MVLRTSDALEFAATELLKKGGFLYPSPVPVVIRTKSQHAGTEGLVFGERTFGMPPYTETDFVVGFVCQTSNKVFACGFSRSELQGDLA